MTRSTRKRKLVLSTFVQLYGTHGDAWRRPGVKAGGTPDFKQWLELVRLLEQGKFDLAFFADFVGSGGDEVGRGGRHPRGGGFEPVTLVSALAAATRHIGLVATVNTNFNHPYNLARQFASLDHLSGGRIGWNIVSSLSEGSIKSFGVKQPLDHEQRYARAGEFVEAARQLWDSWEDGAFDHPDKASGVFFDPASAHPAHLHGEHIDVDALLDIPRPIQGYPVFFQAGNSETGREFAARHADLIYAAAQTIEEAQAYYSDVKGRLAKYGREPDDLIISPGLFFHLGSSRQEAEEKHRAFEAAVDVSGRRQLYGVDLSKYSLDDQLPDNLPEPVNGVGRWRQAVALARREKLTIRQLLVRFSAVQGHRTVVGTAVDIADQIEDWFLNGAADGFNLKPALLPEDLKDFIEQVIPELQKRGIFRTEYEGRTLREHLGLARPANPHTLAAGEHERIAG